MTNRRPLGRPHIIVLGNEKGGSGKSTTAMHVIVALLKRGLRVGSIDLDARQGTLTRLVDNRRHFAGTTGRILGLPMHRQVRRSDAQDKTDAMRAEHGALNAALEEMADLDYLIIDTPGSDNYLARLGHACADTLITPLNDSYLDLDLLARVDIEGKRVLAPSLYSQMVWEQRQKRAKAGLPPTEWIVMRNRLSHIDARNKREIARLLDQLGERIRFRVVPGFGERVIYRELFPRGLTLLDLREDAADIRLNMSHVAARQEVRALVAAIGLPDAPADAPMLASGTG